MFGRAPDRLGQAPALYFAAGELFDLGRARQRAEDEGPQMFAALTAFLELTAAVSGEGPIAIEPSQALLDAFRRRLDDLGVRG